jgi:flagellar FliL protein
MLETNRRKPDEPDGDPRKNWLDNKAVLLGFIIFVQGLVAFGLTQYLILPKLGHTQAGFAASGLESELVERGELVDLEDIIVTLASQSRRTRYLRININLEVRDRQTAEAVRARIPEMRDKVIMTLSEKSVEDLNRPGGKINLRAEIFKRLEDTIPGGQLMNVYFSDLVIQ